MGLTLTTTVLPADAVHSEVLPDPLIPGFAFPESEATLTRWITEMTRGDAPTAAAAFEYIHRHGWGLWTALTAETRQTYAGQRLRVFETWLTLDDLSLIPADALGSFSTGTWRRVPLQELPAFVPSHQGGADDGLSVQPALIDRMLGFVKFDPTAAEHIRRQRLLHVDALTALLDGGAQQIPPFPATALVIKPLFQIIRANDLVDGRYYALKSWSGPPATPRTSSPAQWPGAVWIDVLGGGSGRGALDPIALFDGTTRTDETTYPLDALIHYRLSVADVGMLNVGKESPIAGPGDVAILVAMHVSGRETARWTWQTFWWTPAPDTPPAPSSAAVANLRPDALQGAARNYAMALGYTMLSPDQPYTGGRNSTPAVYTYNPWFEARMGPADLPDSMAGLGPDGRPASNNVGVQSNCMSCHAQANFNPYQRATAPRFTGARYVDPGAAEFVGTLQLDFLWSIARHAR